MHTNHNSPGLYDDLETALASAIEANCESRISLHQRGDRYMLGIATLFHHKGGLVVSERMKAKQIICDVTTTDEAEIAALHRLLSWGQMKTMQYLVAIAKSHGAK